MQWVFGGDCARRERELIGRVGGESVSGAQRRDLHHADGQLGAVGDHPRFGADHGSPPGDSGGGAGDAAGDDLYRGRSVFHRDGGGSDGDPVGGSDPGRRRDRGPISKQLSDEYMGIANGLRPDRFGWLTQVKVNTQPTGACLVRRLDFLGRFFAICTGR